MRQELINNILFHFVNHTHKYSWSDNGYEVSGQPSDLHPSTDSSYEYTDEVLANTAAIIGWYCDEGYEGNGFAIIKTKDDKYLHRGLSHCSCYGPWSDTPMPSQTWEEMVDQAKRNPEFFEEEKATWEVAAKMFGKIL